MRNGRLRLSMDVLCGVHGAGGVLEQTAVLVSFTCSLHLAYVNAYLAIVRWGAGLAALLTRPGFADAAQFVPFVPCRRTGLLS